MRPESNPEYISEEPGEKIENGVWKPGIFNNYKTEVAAGNSTKDLIKMSSSEVKDTLKVIRNPERDKLPVADRIRAGLVLARLVKELDPSADLHNVIYPELNHTANIACIDEEFIEDGLKNKKIPNCDGVITNLKNHPLFVLCADCPPVAVYDPEHKAIGLFHSGWKGTLEQISPKGIQMMVDKYGTDPSKLLVSIGPSISRENYEVTNDIYQKFSNVYNPEELERIFSASSREGHHFLDLREAIKISLEKSGVQGTNTEASRYCTYRDNDKFSSYRKEGETGDRTGYGITLKEEKQNG